MIKQTKKQMLMLAAIASIGLSAPSAFAQVNDVVVAGKGEIPYVIDARNVVARSGTGLCWRTGYFAPAHAIKGCDDDLLPKSAAPAAPRSPMAPAPARPAPSPAAPGARPAAAAPAAAPTSEKVTFAADAFFDFDKAVLKPEGKSKLDDLSGKLKNITLEVIIAVGHTDSVGSDAYNQRLSVKRSEAVKAYLVSKGIEANRVYTEGKGEKQPAADNKTSAGRAKNRRVEIEVVGTRPRR